MFGTKLRTWMEAHIVRPKKKKDRKKGEKDYDSNCNSPISHSANRSPALHQVHPLNSPVKNVDAIRLQTSTGKPTYNGATNSSATSGGTASVNLSSPESAYSTGYSTDGTSPGASFPPEYYINIRTGTHYFQNNKSSAVRGKRPTEESPAPQNAPGNEPLEVRHAHDNSAIINEITKMTKDTIHQASREMRSSTPFEDAETPKNGTPKKHHVGQQQQQQLKQQSHNLTSNKQESSQHRRSDSYSLETTRKSLTISSSIASPLIASTMQSPRQRSRIRTNPWLSANSSGSSSTAGCFKSRLTLDETSSSSGLKLTESSGSASDVNINNSRDTKTRREFRHESLSAGRSPINQNWRISPAIDLRAKVPLGLARRSTSSSSASSLTRSIRSSEDDITLNEMMGKFDESYVYEKETDILSDSDPTDCEDYVHCTSDFDTGQDGGDENDPFENDFDYIDNGSFLDLDNLDGNFTNTGHCTYFTFTSELTRRSTRLRESFLKRRMKEDNAQHRSTSVRSSSKRQSTRHKKLEEKSSEKRKKRVSQRRKPGLEKCDDVTANLNRVLVERMLLKNSGFNQGSRSVGGTPMCLRRKKHHDVNENVSPSRGNRNVAGDPRSIVGPSYLVNENSDKTVKRRSNSVSYVNGNVVSRHCQKTRGNAYISTFASEIALIEADKEADRKYRELILEAENILVNMKNTSSPVMPSPSRRIHNGLANKRVELIKNTELNIELALSKSRNSQPELQSGSIKDLEHTSPKRQFSQASSPINRFMERNSCLPKDNSIYKQESAAKCPDSPVMSRRTPQASPSRGSLGRARTRQIVYEREAESPKYQEHSNGNFAVVKSHETRTTDAGLFNGNDQILLAAQKASGVVNRKEISICNVLESQTIRKHEIPTSSSSDSDDKYESGRRAPLMTFRSVDMGPIRESSYYCPQSEPVKRKVYAGSATYGRIQKTLGERHVVLRNSDGDTATDDTDDSRRSLREKVAQLRQERMAAETNLNAQDSQLFQHHITQIRRQMLMHTIEGLKRSLEDQSATLKQTCLLEDSVIRDEMP
ncbi:serine-rich adhesin for platelets [Venturia canescens]|uniref:serine-rich adhesin for platelets n=1 Tax=Venturia canescens TaxID=32260 RepID=UPI001C9C4908|nr:serine-rich adhesin for platelets [Venturia canescens]